MASIAPTIRVWQRPRIDKDTKLLTGVAAGIARELCIDVLYVRIALVVLTIAGGWGALIYIGFWIAMRTADPQGYAPRPKGLTERHRMTGFLFVVIGLLVIVTELSESLPGALVWPSLLIGIAIAAVWQGAPDELADWSADDMLAPRVLVGFGLLLAGIVVALTLSLSFWQAASGILVAGLVLLGAGALLAPLVSKLGNNLIDERRARIRIEERADMAAHLHDSVLQTLTLIQKQASDSEVVGLARRQERELRSWLFGDQNLTPNLGFRAELEGQMAELETDHGVPIELVVVGDAPLSEPFQALVGATREATTNAAKHSGASRIDVFAEISPNQVEVFVRDQGAGFDPDDIAADRRGVRDSIVARMERHGGKAVIASSLGSGTEVELCLPLKRNRNAEVQP